MHDRELCLEVLRQIEGAATKISNRFKVIHQASDFTDSPAGVEKLDSICMMLIVLGESLKNLEKSPEERYSQNILKSIGKKPWACAISLPTIMRTCMQKLFFTRANARSLHSLKQ